MESVCIVLRKAPYGTVLASEAVRHALGGVVEEMQQVALVLLDAGVYAAKKDQDTSATEYQSIGEGIVDCLDMGVDVYADKNSMKEQGIEPANLLEGVKALGSSEVAGLIKDAGTVMIF
jgi:sulfur relay (sulfurtransferase) DsrF/TusC family protein